MTQEEYIIHEQFINFKLITDDEVNLRNLSISVFFPYSDCKDNMSTMTLYLDLNDDTITFVNIETDDLNRALFSITGPTSAIVLISKENAMIIENWIRENTNWQVENGKFDISDNKLTIGGEDE